MKDFVYLISLSLVAITLLLYFFVIKDCTKVKIYMDNEPITVSQLNSLPVGTDIDIETSSGGGTQKYWVVDGSPNARGNNFRKLIKIKGDVR